MVVANFSEFRNNLKSYLDDVEDNHETLIIKRSKGKGTVVISMEEYNSMNETKYLLSSKKNANYLKESIEQLEKGKLVEVELDI